MSASASRPLRIVQAAAFPFPSPQGSQVYVRGMARALARRGHEVVVACYAHGLGEPDPEYRVVRTPAVPGYRNLRAGPDPVKPLLDAALALRLLRIPADLVHAHNYEAPLAAALARRLNGVPMVYGAHNTMSDELHTYFRSAPAQVLARRLGHALDRVVPRLADHAVVLSEGAVGRLHALGCGRVSHVAPGIEPEDLEPVAPAPLPPGPWVVYAGNPDRYQDLDVLLAAMHRLPQARLLMVSASPLDAWQPLAPASARFVVTDDFARVRALLQAADLAALPRAVCGGFPMKLLNYLGMGLPTVAARGGAPALPGVVRVPDRDPLAMAAALQDLLARPTARRALGAQGRQHVLTRCTWAARAAELEEVYGAVLDRKRGPRAGSTPLAL